MKTLEKTHMFANLKSDREHVTSFITNRPNEFKIKNFKYKKTIVIGGGLLISKRILNLLRKFMKILKIIH